MEATRELGVRIGRRYSAAEALAVAQPVARGPTGLEALFEAALREASARLQQDAGTRSVRNGV